MNGQFPAIHKRVVELEHEIWQSSSAMKSVDWRGKGDDRYAEYRNFENTIAVAQNELDEINKLIAAYNRRTMIMTPAAVITITTVVLLVFVTSLLTVALLAGHI